MFTQVSLGKRVIWIVCANQFCGKDGLVPPGSVAIMVTGHNKGMGIQHLVIPSHFLTPCHDSMTPQNPIPHYKLLRRLPDPLLFLHRAIVSSTLRSTVPLLFIVTRFPFVSGYYFLPVPVCYPLPLFLL